MYRLLFVGFAFCCFSAVPCVAQVNESIQWVDRAYELSLKIENDQQQSHAFYTLTYSSARAKRFELAMKCAEKVANAQKRVYAYAFIARQAAKSNSPDSEAIATQAAMLARETADGTDNVQASSHVVTLLLEFDRVDEAVKFSNRLPKEPHQDYAVGLIGAWLAGRGEVDRAVKIVGISNRSGFRNGSYSQIAVACIETGDIEQAKKVMALISDETGNDSPRRAMAKHYGDLGDFEKAKQIAEQVSSVHRRSEMLAEIVVQEMATKNRPALVASFSTETDRKAKLKVAELIVSRSIEENELEKAIAWIDRSLDAIAAEPLKPQASKFGMFDDSVCIATAKAMHLDIATAYHANGDTEKAVEHFDIAKAAIAELDESSGLGKVFLQQRLLTAVMRLNSKDLLPLGKENLKFMDSLGLATQSALLVKANEIDEALDVADDIKAGPDTGSSIRGLISALVQRKHNKDAVWLLKKLDASDDIHLGYEALGKAMVQWAPGFHDGPRKILMANRKVQVDSILLQFKSDVARAHACIGIADALNGKQ